MLFATVQLIYLQQVATLLCSEYWRNEDEPGSQSRTDGMDASLKAAYCGKCMVVCKISVSEFSSLTKCILLPCWKRTCTCQLQHSFTFVFSRGDDSGEWIHRTKVQQQFDGCTVLNFISLHTFWNPLARPSDPALYWTMWPSSIIHTQRDTYSHQREYSYEMISNNIIESSRKTLIVLSTRMVFMISHLVDIVDPSRHKINHTN